MQSKFYKFFLFIGISFLCQSTNAQIYINELDSDSPGIDDKEFVEIRTANPYTSLAGHVLVYFNGNSASTTANQSYYAISLNSLTTDTNGLVTIGNIGVSPVPNVIFADNIIQNGEDAIAIYQGTLADWPDGTLATTTNLVHALAYDTSDPDALALMALLGIVAPQVQMNENENNLQATESIQRKNNGAYEVKAPTPGAMNDGSGFIYNGLKINVNTAHHNEGDTLQIQVITQTPVTSTLNFNLGFSNGNFNTSDYTGNVAVTIPVGGTTFNTVITLTDDVLDEGDEVAKVKFLTLPFGYNKLNDNLEVRVVDNDYKVDPWGTPLNPTYGIVTSSSPVNYYTSLNGLSGNALKQQLQNIIADSLVVRAHNYGDAFDILKEADHNPKNGNQVWLMYVEQPRAKLDQQTSGSGTGKWNREHIYPQSRGGFANGTDDLPNGPTVFLPTNANNLLAGHADAHHLRAEDAIENSTRNNKDYGGSDYNGTATTQNSWRGDVSRALMYMAVRYNGLNLISGNPNDTTKFYMGDLDSMLSWNKSDPRDDFEMYRNNYIYDVWQKNRNPFIDLPELADYIWGSKAGMVYNGNVAIADVNGLNFSIYPNPMQHTFTIAGLQGNTIVKIYNMFGQEVLSAAFQNQISLKHSLAPGVYVCKVYCGGKVAIKQIAVR